MLAWAACGMNESHRIPHLWQLYITGQPAVAAAAEAKQETNYLIFGLVCGG
jgi:hypothetical protein